jgi:hypothetical protein
MQRRLKDAIEGFVDTRAIFITDAARCTAISNHVRPFRPVEQSTNQTCLVVFHFSDKQVAQLALQIVVCAFLITGFWDEKLNTCYFF